MRIITQRIYRKYPHLLLIVGYALLAGTYFLNQKTGNFIESVFPSTHTNPDLLFMILPYIPRLKYTSDIIALIVPLYTMIINYTKNLSFLLKYIYSLVIGLISRAILITLTPLAQPSIIHQNYGFFKLVEPTGSFPSGHTLAVFLSYLIFRSKPNSKVKYIILFLVYVESLSLIISHTHYTLDIIGGLMVAYVSLKIIDKYFPFHLPSKI